ncbi:DUF6174 domain-containing protein [Nocardioides sp. SYSU DS0651]|uniref:DUF6174 domain-containing protein n=1 Tax=Nocardioides sp. SYSU DS0651 TaxID=3415955 RepID=UPI003F4C95C6
MRTPPGGHRPRPRLRRAAAGLLASAAVGVLAGCAGEDDQRARDGGDRVAESPGDGPTEGSGTGSTGPGDYPEFEPDDYVYRLEVLCYCPQAGPVRVRVRDGDVVAARSLGGRGVEKGDEAPEFARLTINEIIAQANDPEVDRVDVTWPEGQDHPSVVELDHLADAVDDEVTYTISRVRVTG